MTSLLQWRFATKADAGMRQAFTCADPPKVKWTGGRDWHPRPWEIEVQSWARAHPVARDERLLLGLDSQGIAAMGAWVHESGPADVLVQILAVHVRHRRQGGACAKEALATVLNHIDDEARTSGAADVAVLARIHQGNLPSQNLVASAGFVNLGPYTDQLDRWACLRTLYQP